MAWEQDTYGIGYEKLFACDSASKLMHCSEFYRILERFCSDAVTSNSKYEVLLNEYFNDEGYIDIWRIPHLMLDVFMQNDSFHNALSSESFRTDFQLFLADLYNFALNECRPYLFVRSDSGSTQQTLLDFKTRQKFLNTLMDTFSRVLENIENESKVEMSA